MSELKLNNPKVLASLSAGIAAGFVPQFTQAALVTVGGDGGTGSVTLSNPGDSTNLGGVLVNTIQYSTAGAGYRYLNGAGGQRLFLAIRSSVANSGATVGNVWSFMYSGIASDGAVFSDDNWVPGHFTVAGVNGGGLIWGWLHVELTASGADPTIISFTYDDAATGTAKFVKPIGGFQVGPEPVPEPSTLSLAALALGAAGVVRRRRYMKARASA